MASKEALRKQMNEDGALIDKKENSCYFKSCCACSANFEQSLKPALLECGHFICQDKQCLRGKQCPKCNKPLKIKKNPYQTLLSYLKFFQQKTENNEPKLYNFIISTFDKRQCQSICNISQDQTLNFIINSYFSDQIDKFADSAKSEININGSSQVYHQIQAKTIKEYNQFFFSSKPNDNGRIFINKCKPNTNIIRFVSRRLGGNQM